MFDHFSFKFLFLNFFWKYYLIGNLVSSRKNEISKFSFYKFWAKKDIFTLKLAGYCATEWLFLCWPESLSNSSVLVNCPDYIGDVDRSVRFQPVDELQLFQKFFARSDYNISLNLKLSQFITVRHFYYRIITHLTMSFSTLLLF